MAKRTEGEIVSQAPIVVILGGKEYKIAPLVIRDSREWRKKAIGLISELPQILKITMDEPEQFKSALTDMMVTKPDEVIDLFFEYAKNLNRDEIEAIATDTELGKAFEEVAKLAFPLAESLPKALARLSE